MTESVSRQWGSGDVLGRILEAMEESGISTETMTIEALAPVDHFHARGFLATKELADSLPIRTGDHLVDIGCGVGGPARYLADRFSCRVDGIDITEPFVLAANELSRLTGMSERVTARLGDGQSLPFQDEVFDGGYSQHVTMNVADRHRFFSEAFRVLRPGAFFALTEHGQGEGGPLHHPVPWSDDGTHEYLMRPSETVERLRSAGFNEIEITETGEKYLQGYRKAIALAERGELPRFGVHILLGATAPAKTRNAARNIEEGRTRPVQIICRKPGKTR
jgi:ubiquinone/menaquinone biosynthesis C-methylase UbiE